MFNNKYPNNNTISISVQNVPKLQVHLVTSLQGIYHMYATTVLSLICSIIKIYIK